MKDAYYFSHDSNARSDPKITAMMYKYGIAGYGAYWAIIEMMRETREYKLPLKESYFYDSLNVFFNMQNPILQCKCNANALQNNAKNFIEDSIQKYKLFSCDEYHFWSDSLIERMKIKDDLSEKRKRAADKRWEKDKKKKIPQESNASAMQSNASAMQGKESKVKESKVITPLPPNEDGKTFFDSILDLYNEILPELDSRLQITSSRYQDLKALMQEDEKYSTLDYWKGFFENIRNMPHLMGERTDFKADFEWLIKHDNFIMILEGKYLKRISTQVNSDDNLDAWAQEDTTS